MSGIGRRTLITGTAGMVPRLGRSSPSRFPYPDRPESGPGLGAGPGNLTRARNLVIGPNGGWFIYSGNPGPGNPPVEWAVPPGVTQDLFGNPLPATGVVAENTATGQYAQLSAGIVKFWPGSGFNPGSIAGVASGELGLASPTISAGDTAATMQMLSVQSGPAPFAGFATVNIIGPVLVTQFTGSPAGVIGHQAVTQVDATTNSNANSIVAEDITFTWGIPANDATLDTKYKIDVPLTGTWETAQLNLGIMLDGVFTNITPVAAGAITATHGIAGNAVLTLTCTGSGAGGAMNVHLDGTLTDSSIARTPAGSVDLGGQHNSLPFDTTVAHTVAVAAQWGAAVAGQVVNGVGSEFIRSGS